MPADRRIARGIYKTSSGWRLFVRVGGRLKPKRLHDPDHRLGLVELRQRRDDHAAAVRHAPARGAAPGTFAADARTKYLPAVRALPGYTERVYHIELWIAQFGDRARATIQPWEIAKVRDRWLTEGPKRVCVAWDKDHPKPKGCTVGRWTELQVPLSASQVNNRLRALENLWTVLDGRHAYNPVREAGEATEPEPEARAIAYDVIDQILAAMPDRGRGERGKPRADYSLTKLRLRVIAYTGFSHGELVGIDADDLHLDAPRPWVWVGGRRKGRGTKGTAQPLTEVAAAALRALVAVGGLGPFSADSMRQSFRRACATLGLEGLRPYDLRHSYPTELLKQTDGNVGATQLMMRHKDPRTTLRYAKGAIDPVRLATVERMQDRGAFARKRLPASYRPRRKPAKRRAKNA